MLYGDLSLVRVPWEEKRILRRTGVLAISVVAAGHPRNRRQSSISHDWYQLIWTDVDSCLTGHDGDYGFCRFDDPNIVDWRFPFILPENSIEFEGVYTKTQEDWKAALVIYADQSGQMF